MLLELILGVIVLILLLYVWMSWKFTFWTNLGVYQVPTQFPFGSAGFYFKKKAHFIDVLIKQAKETKNLPYYGFYFMHSPMLVVTDVDMVRNITVKDLHALYLTNQHF